jgi:pullulanase
MKQMVKGLHDNGISVIMDVVYNHVYNAGNFCFNQIVPGYFSRPNSNGSGCGNDTASERLMVRKYIVESVVYWADEYHIDGFRFDLVGLIDTDTINQIIEEVHKTHPNVKFYGEGWNMGTNLTKPATLTNQSNSSKTPEFAFFNDTFRDLLKGSVFGTSDLGFASGANGKEATLKQCFMGQVSWCKTPTQTINYASCHDNYTLIDRIVVSTPGATWEDQVKMNNLAAAIYMTSQGIPLIHAGEEMLRSKPLSALGEVAEGEIPYDHNSYNKSDAINSLKWNDLSKDEYKATYEYYKGLIDFRKAHPALRLTKASDVKANVKAVSGTAAKVVAFTVNGGINGETSDGIFVIFNANANSTTVKLPEGTWNICINGENAGTKVLGTASGSVEVDGISAMVLVKA